jgi:Ca2+-binding RTX toxin-like protein
MTVETITGSDESDQIFGTSADDLILAGAGDDFVATDSGLDSVYGEADNDVILAYSAGSLLDGGEGDDSLTTSDHHSALIGVLLGGDGNDQLFAGDRRDRCFGGAGDDTITIRLFQWGAAHGGQGIDRLDLRFVDNDLQRSDDDVVALLTGADAGVSFGDTGRLVISGFESLSIALGSGNDQVRGGALADTIALGRGQNSAQAMGGDDLVSYHTGAANQLSGGGGHDILQVFQSDPDEALIFTAAPGTATDQNGSVISGFEAYDVLGGAVADEVLLGGGDDVAQLGWGGDRAIGRGGNDWLFGDQGFDRLFGGDGDDILVGGLGFDLLTGGAGADHFQFEDLRHCGDRIRDFTPGEDLLVLSQPAIDYALPTGLVPVERFSLDVASGSSAQFVYRAGATPGESELIWDINGASALGEVLVARFLGNPLLTSDSVLIL